MELLICYSANNPTSRKWYEKIWFHCFCLVSRFLPLIDLYLALMNMANFELFPCTNYLLCLNIWAIAACARTPRAIVQKKAAHTGIATENYFIWMKDESNQVLYTSYTFHSDCHNRSAHIQMLFLIVCDSRKVNGTNGASVCAVAIELSSKQ